MARITIVKFDELNPRKDRKTSTWFRVNNDIAHSETLDELEADQKWFWICLLGFASKKMVGTVDYNVRYFAKHFGLAPARIEDAIEKLMAAGAVTVERDEAPFGAELIVGATPADTDRLPVDTVATPPDTNSDHNFPDRCPTYVRTYERTKRESTSSAGTLPRLAEIWNANCGSLPAVTKSSAKRRRLSSTAMKLASEDEWVDAIRRVASSEFCLGKNDRGWKATFDFLIRDGTLAKILEGNYDNRRLRLANVAED